VREDSGNAEASWAFYIHEIRVGGLYETLELVPLGLGLGGGVEKIDGERHGIPWCFCEELLR